MPTQYVTVQVTPDAREALRRWQLQLAAAAGRRLSLGDALRAACTVAEAHTAEAVEALAAD
jgi:hypothetical protein